MLHKHRRIGENQPKGHMKISRRKKSPHISLACYPLSKRAIYQRKKKEKEKKKDSFKCNSPFLSNLASLYTKIPLKDNFLRVEEELTYRYEREEHGLMNISALHRFLAR